jgi:hypothetical protein
MSINKNRSVFLVVLGLLAIAAVAAYVFTNPIGVETGSVAKAEDSAEEVVAADPASDSQTTSEIAETQISTANDSTGTTAEDAATEKEAPLVESAAAGEQPTTRPEVTIFTEDDRSAGLQRATNSWNTNWNKHTIQYDELLSGGPPRDGIPSIDDPQFISPSQAEDWLADNEPVIALEIDGEARAYPLQVLTWHEIVNDIVGEVPVAVTFCPLCNSAITFDRRFNGQVFEFGTSGLLRHSDLVMYDRTTETLWQQFTGEGIVGDLAAEQLELIPSSLIGFGDFKKAHPDGLVLSRETGFNRRYGENPYAGYDAIGNNPFLFRGPTDGRLSAMERVVTVSLDDVDIAYPLSILAEVGTINDTQDGRDLAILHTGGTSSALGARVIAQAEDVGATGVFDRNLNGQILTFSRGG